MVISGNEHPMWAQPPRGGEGHGRMHPVLTGEVVGRSHPRAPPPTITGLPCNDGSRFSSTAAKKASKSRCATTLRAVPRRRGTAHSKRVHRWAHDSTAFAVCAHQEACNITIVVLSLYEHLFAYKLSVPRHALKPIICHERRPASPLGPCSESRPQLTSSQEMPVERGIHRSTGFLLQRRETPHQVPAPSVS